MPQPIDVFGGNRQMVFVNGRQGVDSLRRSFLVAEGEQRQKNVFARAGRFGGRRWASLRERSTFGVSPLSRYGIPTTMIQTNV